VIETALTVALLTSGGLLLETFRQLRNTDLGVLREKLLTFETPLLRYKEFDRRDAFLTAVLEKIRAIPGVIHRGVTDSSGRGSFRVSGSGRVAHSRVDQVIALRSE
jgi:hypothetical protein